MLFLRVNLEETLLYKYYCSPSRKCSAAVDDFVLMFKLSSAMCGICGLFWLEFPNKEITPGVIN